MGVLHANAVLDADELVHARDIGLEILPTEKPLFALPCPRLEGTVCGVYEERPRVCARYKCQLLQDFEAGTTPMAEARATVAEAQAIVTKLQAALPAGMTLHQARRLALGAEPDQGQGVRPSPRETAVVRVLASAMEWFIDRHFRNSRDGRSYEMSAIDVPEKQP